MKRWITTKIKKIIIIIVMITLNMGVCTLMINQASEIYIKEVMQAVSTTLNQKDELLENAIKDLSADVNWLSKFIVNSEMDSSELQLDLSFIIAEKAYYEDIIVIDSNGNLLNGYVKDIEDLINEPFMKKALTGDTSVSSRMQISEAGENYMVAPLVDASEDVLGVTLIRIADDTLEQVLSPVQLPNSLDVYLVDNNGYFITQSKHSETNSLTDRVDIDKVKINVNYSTANTYINFAEKEVFGNYKEIEEYEYYLVVEEGNYVNDLIVIPMMKLSAILTITEIIFIFWIERYNKKELYKLKEGKEKGDIKLECDSDSGMCVISEEEIDSTTLIGQVVKPIEEDKLSEQKTVEQIINNQSKLIGTKVDWREVERLFKEDEKADNQIED